MTGKMTNVFINVSSAIIILKNLLLAFAVKVNITFFIASSY